MVSNCAVRNLETLLAGDDPSTLFGRPVVMRDSVVADKPKPRLPRRREILRSRKASASLAKLAEEIMSRRGTDREMFDTMFGL